MQIGLVRGHGGGVRVVKERRRGGWIVAVVVIWRGHDGDGAVVRVNERGRDAGERALGAEVVEIHIPIIRDMSSAEKTLFSDRGRKGLALFTGGV